MKIVQINVTNKIGSTGKIMDDLDKEIRKHGYHGYKVCAYTTDYTDENLYCTNKGNYIWSVKKDIAISRVTGITGHRYKHETRKVVQWLEKIRPDIIHLHNIHGDWINLKILFQYIKKNSIPIVWTLHDCWAFTGRCSHFEMCGCDKWKTGCYECTNNKVYPITYFFDFSKKMWKEKKELFNGLDCRIVVPSAWLENYVKDSFLNNYPVHVIHNGIDTDIYTHRKVESNTKKIVLGVANSWSKNKGFDDFIQLSEKLNPNEYQIMMVGLNEEQIKKIPKSIIGIKRTNNQQELADIYSAADVFVNPTYQDNYPTTNLEAIACGTLAITYNTGGSPESMISNEYVFEKGDIDGLYNIIVAVCNKKPYTTEFLQDYAKRKFDKSITVQEYIRLYEDILKADGTKEVGIR